MQIPSEPPLAPQTTPPTEQPQQAIQFLFFDLGNVLIHFSHWQACQQLSACIGQPPELIFDEIFQADYLSDYECGRISEKEFFQRFSQQVKSNISLADFQQAFNEIFWPNEPVLELAVKLQQRRLPISILSNTCEGHWGYIYREYPILRGLFPNPILSFETGCAKPDLAIYQAAIARADAEPNQIFFIDDRPENIAGARAAGMDAELFTTLDDLENQLRQRNLL